MLATTRGETILVVSLSENRVFYDHQFIGRIQYVNDHLRWILVFVLLFLGIGIWGGINAAGSGAILLEVIAINRHLILNMSFPLRELVGPSGLILLAAIIGAIGAFWAALQQSESEKALTKKSDEITDLNRKIAGLVTGGDSFCWFKIGNLDPVTNVGYLMMIHHGTFPIFDVKARIVDLETFEKKKGKMTIHNIFSDDIIIDVGSMPVGTGSVSSQFNMGSSDRKSFNIFFSARNGLYSQLLRLRKVDGAWLQATRVYMPDGNNEKLVFEQIDSTFPLAELDWEK